MGSKVAEPAALPTAAEVPPPSESAPRPLIDLEALGAAPSSARLSEAIAQAPARTEEERAALAAELVKLLESGALARLEGDGGTQLEAVAAARVLELGYPWALHLTPQQLSRARRGLPRPCPTGPSRLASAGAAGTGIAFALTYLPLAMDGRARVFDHLFAAEAAVAVAAHFLFADGRLPRWALGLGSLALYAGAWYLSSLDPFTVGGRLGLAFGLLPFGLGALAALLPGGAPKR